MFDYVLFVIVNFSPRTAFEARVKMHFVRRRNQKLIMSAYDLAWKVFINVQRKNGEPFFLHKVSTALILMEVGKIRDADTIAAALVHDVPEDISGWDRFRIARCLNRNVADIVNCVTKRLGESTPAYYRRVASRYESILVKMADRIHNMMTLWGSEEKKLLKVHETFDYVTKLRVNNQELEILLLQGIARQMLALEPDCVEEIKR